MPATEVEEAERDVLRLLLSRGASCAAPSPDGRVIRDEVLVVVVSLQFDGAAAVDRVLGRGRLDAALNPARDALRQGWPAFAALARSAGKPRKRVENAASPRVRPTGADLPSSVSALSGADRVAFRAVAGTTPLGRPGEQAPHLGSLAAARAVGGAMVAHAHGRDAAALSLLAFADLATSDWLAARARAEEERLAGAPGATEQR